MPGNIVGASCAHIYGKRELQWGMGLKWSFGTRDFVPGPNSKIIMLEKISLVPPLKFYTNFREFLKNSQKNWCNF